MINQELLQLVTRQGNHDERLQKLGYANIARGDTYELIHFLKKPFDEHSIGVVDFKTFEVLKDYSIEHTTDGWGHQYLHIIVDDVKQRMTDPPTSNGRANPKYVVFSKG